MTFLDVAKIALTVIGSVGGAGALIFGLSGFLGKVWADRALEKLKHDGDLALEQQRHEYAQLSQRAQERVDTGLKRVQMQLDTLGLIHSLRTKEEFARLGELWKLIIELLSAFDALTFTGLQFGSPEELKALKMSERNRFEEAIHLAMSYFRSIMIFIPEEISIVTEDLLNELAREPVRYRLSLGIEGGNEAYLTFLDRLRETASGERNRLELLIRNHIRGEERPH